MKYSTEPPPIYERAKKLWGVDFENGGVVFTYGDTCHTSSGDLPEWLIPHEEVHVTQQGKYPDQWWKRYFIDPTFRYEQELEAYRVQYQWVKKYIKGRQQQFNFLNHFAKDLSGPMYGNIINFHKALAQIQKV